jgi:GT2 family glycosyltransferase
VHDDVFIHDVFLRERLVEAFRRFDVVGLAGSRRSDLNQPSWGLRFDEDSLDVLGWQSSDIVLSGAVSHLNEAYGHDHWPEPLLSLYGPTPDFCTLLDGLFLAVRTAAIRKNQVRFDTRFDFHLYDIDFCRAATEAGMLLGTWPILVTHGSGGNFASPEFKTAARNYLAKWNVRQFERDLGIDSRRLVNGAKG